MLCCRVVIVNGHTIPRHTALAPVQRSARSAPAQPKTCRNRPKRLIPLNQWPRVSYSSARTSRDGRHSLGDSSSSFNTSSVGVKSLYPYGETTSLDGIHSEFVMGTSAHAEARPAPDIKAVDLALGKKLDRHSFACQLLYPFRRGNYALCIMSLMALLSMKTRAFIDAANIGVQLMNQTRCGVSYGGSSKRFITKRSSRGTSIQFRRSSTYLLDKVNETR